MSDAMMVLFFFVGGYGMRMLIDLLRYGEFQRGGWKNEKIPGNRE